MSRAVKVLLEKNNYSVDAVYNGEEALDYLDSGANDYLTKPFHTKELLAGIRAMMRTQNVQTDSCLRFGNITLNRATFEMSSPTENFRLANKEFPMMEIHESHTGLSWILSYSGTSLS